MLRKLKKFLEHFYLRNICIIENNSINNPNVPKPSIVNCIVAINF